MRFIIIKETITKKTIKTNLLKFHAPAKSPCNNLDIALVKPQAGQLQPANKPVTGQFALKTKGNKKCLKMHLKGTYFKLSVGRIPKNRRIEVRLKNLACGVPKLSISKNMFFTFLIGFIVKFIEPT